MSTTHHPQPQPWPDKPFIRVISGYETGVGLVTDALALRDAAGCYRLEGGGLLVPDTGDVIETWEEMRAVPVYRASQITASLPRHHIPRHHIPRHHIPRCRPPAC